MKRVFRLGQWGRELCMKLSWLGKWLYSGPTLLPSVNLGERINLHTSQNRDLTAYRPPLNRIGAVIGVPMVA